MLRKSGLIVVFILMVGIIAACSSDDSSDSSAEQSQNESEEAADNKENQERDDSEEEGTSEEDQGEQETEETDEAENPEPAYYISEETSSIEPIDDAEEDVVLLTIDDAPDENALEMAETLKEKDAKAIFFVNGHFIEDEEGEEKLKKIHDMGFPIGNHTNTHVNLAEVSEEEQTDEIVALNDQIEEIIGERPAFFRAPHGVNTDHSREVVEQEGMVLMNWTYGFDYFEQYEDADKLKEALISGKAPEIGEENSLLRSGANILMHDREWTNEALGDVIDGMREQGYEIADPNLIETID